MEHQGGRGGTLAAAALGLGSLLPDTREAVPSRAPRPLSAGSARPTEGGGRRKPVALPPPPPPVPRAPRGRQDNLANELVKGPLVTRPGLPPAHLGNSTERLRASPASAVCRRGRREPGDDAGPYIKIITRRNRWPTPGRRGASGSGSRRRQGRGAARPREGRGGQARRPRSLGWGVAAAERGLPGQFPGGGGGAERRARTCRGRSTSLSRAALQGRAGRVRTSDACDRVCAGPVHARFECAHVGVVVEGGSSVAPRPPCPRGTRPRAPGPERAGFQAGPWGRRPAVPLKRAARSRRGAKPIAKNTYYTATFCK